MRPSDARIKASHDVCGCCVGCYPNGLVSLLIAQVLLLIAFLLSGTAMFDCRFVTADVFAGSSIPPDNFTAWGQDARTGYGFISYQDASGACLIQRWTDELEKARNNVTDPEVEDYVNDYIDWLGDDWDRARNCLGSALGASFIVFFWVIAMMCIAHIRALRILAAAILFLGIMPLQFAPLLVLGSEFCAERNCTPGRSGVAAVFAGAMYFSASIALLSTRNYHAKREEEEDFQPPEEQRRPSTQSPEVEMVDIFEDASFVVIEEDRDRHDSADLDEFMIGDGLAEAQEIKPDMVFLHDDGQGHEPSLAMAQQPPPVAAAPAAARRSFDEIPTATDVHVLEDFTKTKVAP